MRSGRKAVIAVLGGGLVACCALVLVWGPSLHKTTKSLYQSARKRSIKALSQAADDTELMRSVGGLGIVLRTQNGGWIAIRYTDSHGDPFFSSSVARCSDNSWYESRKHFCGLFEVYRREKDWINGFIAPTEEQRDQAKSNLAEYAAEDADFAGLLRIEAAQNLGVAKPILEGLGFTPLSGSLLSNR